MSFETISGPSNIVLDEAAHIFIPGRGRTADGMDISTKGSDRILTAAELYRYLDASDHGFNGHVIPSGYKTPFDMNGNREEYFDAVDGTKRAYIGVPEAVSGAILLEEFGVRWNHIVPEINSVDTVTNFTRTEHGGYFGKGDQRPVAIVAQQAHLERMLKIIAPRTLKRDYIGVIVAEKNETDKENRTAAVFSRLILAGTRPDTPDQAEITVGRTARIEKLVQAVQKLRLTQRG